MDLERISRIVEAVRSDGRDALVEDEGLELLAAMGIETPPYFVVGSSDQVSPDGLWTLGSDQVVIKVISPDIPHKSDVGGVGFVQNDLETVRDAVRRMEEAFAGADVRGYLIQARVAYDPSLGGELLVGVRWTEDFGAVLAFGAGGIYTEFLAQHFKPGSDIALASPEVLDAKTAEALIRRAAVTHLLTGGLRGQAARLPIEDLVSMFLRFAELARHIVPETLRELEVNPFVITEGRLVPLDVLARCGHRVSAPVQDRPLHKLENLFRPRSIAVVGVSDRMNPGRVILVNTLKAGFDRRRLFVVKPGSESIEGCACFDDVSSLPETVDLIVLAVAAEQIPSLLDSIITARKAETVLIVPGGLEEKAGSQGIVAELRTAIAMARASEWGGPLIVGGNSMGIRSQPGRYDTTFIPDYKLPVFDSPAQPVALITQSGAFYAAKGSKLGFAPRYMISVGNQMDLTIGDYLNYLADDPEIKIFAVYAEGFQPLDGLRFLQAVQRITADGRTVILYRAGRTAEGAAASASHTAAIAGDYAVTRQLAISAGAIVCETTEDFEDLLRLFAFLGAKRPRGLRLGALSNAGFETVAMADHLGDLRLAELTDATRARLGDLFQHARIGTIVDVHNPVDLTPMMGDAVFAAAARVVMEDENVDLGLVGCVPLSPALQTLTPDDTHPEDVGGGDSIARRLARLEAAIDKPWVAVVDGGRRYEARARILEEAGIPTFRSADRAVHLLGLWAAAMLERP
ncbi:MAG: acetate--CoA ligase family protein [Gemmatimonadales bacterium]|jgi:acyl-CoA synthetase (NDP forming)